MLPLLAFLLVAVLLVFPIWSIVKVLGHDGDLTALRRRLRALEEELKVLRSAPSRPPEAAEPPVVAPASPPRAAPVQSAPPLVAARPAAAPPLRPEPSTARYAPNLVKPAGHRPAVNWEQFMGVKLFAWLGGLALFLGIAFFVKYSFEHDLIPPAVRVTLGFVTGLGLVVGGLWIPRGKYRITAQTLVAAGIVSLYVVTFACNSIYHFPFFGPVPTFVLLALTTAAAFFLADRLDAQVVAVLGILAGFLTPFLISTGQDNPVGLFGYSALLVLGLGAVALRRGWLYLVPLGAAGSVLILAVWIDKFYEPAKLATLVAASLVFSAIHFLVYAAGRRNRRAGLPLLGAAVGMPAFGLALAAFILLQAEAGARPGLLFCFIFASDALLLAVAWLDERMARLPFAGGVAVFLLLACWTTNYLTDALLPWALAASLALAALHTAFPLFLAKRRPGAVSGWWNQLFPPLALVLLIFPIFQDKTASFLLWPAFLLIDALALGVAVLSASLAFVAVVLVLTLLAAGLCLFQLPVDTALDPSLLLVTGGFAVFFFLGGLWVARRLGSRLPAGDPRLAGFLGGAPGEIPALSSLLPFVLLILACGRLAVPDPTLVFGLGFILVLLALILARLLRAEWLPACALAGSAALEFTWHVRHFNAAAPGRPLAWYLGFYAVFAAYPFLFRRAFAKSTGPWAAAALSGAAHFWIIWQAIKHGWSNPMPGLVPAAFAAAPLASLHAVWRGDRAAGAARLNQLAWFGGAALYFLTLIVPIQFDRQWLTVGWALEGAALLWLFHRVPHPGLRATGVILLVIAFARLAGNPAVFSYQVRGETGLFNWYLYAYGLTIAALFTGGRLLAPPRQRVFGLDAQPPVYTLAVVLSFLLLNIEIADYFTAPGSPVLTFEFSGNFARDMCYTIAWALFALALLAAGIWRRQRNVRYAAIGLLSAALLKLFFNDLARLEALYRIGALFAVAVIAIVASLAYQRFLPSSEKAASPP